MTPSDHYHEWTRPRPRPGPAITRPILPLSIGHLGLALASGCLDGRLRLSDGRQAVVRAIAQKSEVELSADHSRETVAGSVVVTKEVVIGEKASLRIRVLTKDGVIEEFTN